MKHSALICALLALPGLSAAADISTFSFAGCAFPDSNQSISYTGTSGEDHDYSSSVSAMSFTMYNGADWGGTATSSVTVDNRTGLMWVTNTDDACAGCSGGYVSSGTYIWENALTKCEELTYAGFSDWRLPDVRELMSIVDYGKTTWPRINPTYFPNTAASFYWTSTTYALSTPFAWHVNFSQGSLSANLKASTFNPVRCVRAGPP